MSAPRKPQVLAIIPARGGSKGLPRKNIRILHDKPLIAYSIEVAIHCKKISRIVVSTDDEEIADISRQYGAEVPFIRPAELARCRSTIDEVIGYTLGKLKSTNYSPDIVVLLYPTHPFRTPELVNFLIGKIEKGYSPVYTVKAVYPLSLGFFKQGPDHKLVPVRCQDTTVQPSEQSHYFRHYGIFYGFNFQNTTPYVHVIEDTISLIDIDSEEEFYFAEEIIRAGLYDSAKGNVNDCNHADISVF